MPTNETQSRSFHWIRIHSKWKCVAPGEGGLCYSTFHYTQSACSRAKRCRGRQGNHHFFIDDLASHSFPSPTDFPRADPQSLCVPVMLRLLRCYFQRITHRAVMAFFHPKAVSQSSHFLQQSLWHEDRWSCRRNPDSVAQISMDPPLLHCSLAENSGTKPRLPLL